MWKIGDILEGTDRRRKSAFHYIIYLDDFNGHDFVGAMITTSVRPDLNAAMDLEHFKNDPNFKVQFKDSQLVIAKLRKLGIWGPFKKVGELTNEGIDFVKGEVSDLQLETFDEYEARISREKHF